MKKQQFKMSRQQEMEQEEKLAATGAGGSRRMRTTLPHERDREGTTDELERLRKKLDKGFFDDEEAAQHNNTHHQARRRL